MKYPQLVSTRAVNAISDWLVSQLEQLGVEAPLIYSRLLLSLLHTSVQFNDPTEFNDLETYLSSRKGNKRNNCPCDTDTLKKLTAVQCLMETVSEQEITKIENLIEELCEKLNDIENKQEKNELIVELKDIQQTVKSSSSSALSPTKLNTNEIEDPRKRYYRAFPALSKEMEDSVWIMKKNIKAMTWPTGNNKNNNNDNMVMQTITVVNNNNNNNNNNGNGSNSHTPNVVNSSIISNTAGVKRRLRRPRNQALSKGRMKYTRKNSYCGGGGCGSSGNNYNNNNSSPIWDTDFEGSWEMDYDLIKEFITKQNNRNRRSTSESEACNIRRSEQKAFESITTATNDEFIENSILSLMGDDEEQNYDDEEFYYLPEKGTNCTSSSKLSKFDNPMNNLEETIANLSADIVPLQQNETSVSHNAFMINDAKGDGEHSSMDNDVALTAVASLPETTTISYGDGTLNSARRLYERDVSNDSLHKLDPSSLSEQNDFAQFKAKFNSSVEALWKNNNDGSAAVGTAKAEEMNPSSSTSSSLKHKNLENFWANYYNHLYDVMKDTPYQNNDNGEDEGDGGIESSNIDKTDFYSMPVNFESSKTNSNNTKIEIENNFTSSALFFKNSIWSDKESSLYASSLGASYINESKQNDGNLYESDNTGGSYSFIIPKWSECSFNETSLVPQSSSSNSSSIDASLLNINELRENMLKNSYLCNYKQQSLFVPLTSSSSSNSTFSAANISTIYNQHINNNHNNHLQHHQQQQQSLYHLPPIAPNVLTPTIAPSDVYEFSFKMKITLKNHSSNSGFIEYSRIKSKSIYSKGMKNNNKKKKNDSRKSISAKTENIKNDTNNSSSSSSPNSSSSSCSCGCNGTSTESGRGGSGIGGDQISIDGAAGAGVTIDDTENLLTSDRTHFRPIKQNYADGYVFDISNNIDEIQFERSKSGYLLFESEKYLEYTRLDTFLSDDNQQQQYQQSSSGIIGEELNGNNKKRKNELSLKFRVKQTEKYCQTEQLMMMKTINEKNDGIYHKIENNPFKSLRTEIIEDLHDDKLLHLNENKENLYSLNDENEASINLDKWSMIEIGKECCNQNNNHTIHTLWGMCQACNNNMKSLPANRLLKDELNIEADEIMSDLKYMQDLYIGSSSVGIGNGSRNRNRDHDEGKNYNNDWGNNNDDDDDADADDEDDDIIEDLDGDADDENTDYDAEILKECELYETMVLKTLSEIDNEKTKMKKKEQDHQQQQRHYHHQQKQQQKEEKNVNDDICYDVMKFISDLLKPGNAKSLANALGATTRKLCENTNGNNKKSQQQQQQDKGNTSALLDDGGNNNKDEDDDENMIMIMGMNNNNINTKNNNIIVEKYVGGLWSNENDLENMIWKQQQLPKDYQQKNSFLEKFGNWKYSNLANLWKTTNVNDDDSLTTAAATTTATIVDTIPLANNKNDIIDNKKCADNMMDEDVTELKHIGKNISLSPPHFCCNSLSSSTLFDEYNDNEMRNLENFISTNIIQKKSSNIPAATTNASVTTTTTAIVNKQKNLPSSVIGSNNIDNDIHNNLTSASFIISKKAKNSGLSQRFNYLAKFYGSSRSSSSNSYNDEEIIGDFNDNNDNNDDDREVATIITCKYLATATPSVKKVAKTFFPTATTAAVNK